MWITQKNLKEYLQAAIKDVAAGLGTSLQDCFKVSNQGTIDLKDCVFELYVGSTVTKESASPKELAEIKSLVKGLYDEIAKRAYDDVNEGALRCLGLLNEKEGGALPESSRTEVLDKLHSLMEYQDLAQKDLDKKLTDAFNEHDRKMLLAARANLYKIMNEIWAGRYATDNAMKIRKWATEIKKYSPDDLIAEFCEKAFAEDKRRVDAFLQDHLKSCPEDVVLFVLRTMLGRLEEAYFTPLDYWIEELQNKGNPLFHHYRKRYDEEKLRVERGVYAPDLPRDVFIAFSRDDIETVVAVKNYLEEKGGLRCFLSTTNLRQCDGNEFRNSLQSAIDHCRVFLLISSKSSRMRRSGFCAYKEMEYVRDKELDFYRKENDVNTAYADVPRKYKMIRVEYLLDTYGNTVGEDFSREFFAGLNPCSGLDPAKGLPSLLEAIGRWLNHKDAWNEEKPLSKREEKRLEKERKKAAEQEKAAAAEPILPEEAEEEKAPKKFCASCLAECVENAKFCPECGKTVFVRTREEAKEHKKYKYCVGCLSPNPKSVKYCKDCGKNLFEKTYEEALERQKELKRRAAPQPDDGERAARRKKIFGFAFATFSVVFVVAMLAFFGGLEWWQSQHLVGALCGAMLIIDVFGILWGAGEEDGMMFPGVIAMGFLLIVNLILAFVFKADYRIISFWINAYLLVSFCVTFGYSIGDGEGVPALISVLEFLLTIGSIVAVAKVI